MQPHAATGERVKHKGVKRIMESNEDLVRLADVVESLLAKFNRLKEEKNELERTLQQREEEIRDLNDTLATLQNEKADVYQRVSSILTSIDEWEKGQGSEAGTTETADAQETSTESTPQLFSMEG